MHNTCDVWVANLTSLATLNLPQYRFYHYSSVLNRYTLTTTILPTTLCYFILALLSTTALSYSTIKPTYCTTLPKCLHYHYFTHYSLLQILQYNHYTTSLQLYIGERAGRAAPLQSGKMYIIPVPFGPVLPLWCHHIRARSILSPLYCWASPPIRPCNYTYLLH